MKFNAEKEAENVINFIKEYYKTNNLGGAIIGISGGKDSGVVTGLFTKALGKENVIGVTLPCHSKEEDRIDAKLVSDYYGIKLYNFDITQVFETFKDELKNIGEYDLETTKNSDLNLKPRLRMSTLYYLAALFSAINNKTYLVAGTSNKCELYVGYFTKGGDSVYDISPIADFTVEEVIKIGEYIKVPEQVLYKAPNDGLSNQTDEEKMGVTNKDITSYMEDSNSVDSIIGDKIKKLHNASYHKFNIPTYRMDR